MLLVDANVLLHAIDRGAPRHRAARRWMVAALGGAETVGFPWIALLAFLRLATHPSIFPRPLSPADAVSAVEGWLGAPAAMTVDPSPRHLALLSGLLIEAGTAGNLVNDAHLAALALEHDATIVSFDRDFDRFSGVRRRVPE